MEFLLGYAAGLLTLINPCVLPILPVALATSLQAGRAGPLVLAAGMSLSFVALGLGVTAFGRAVGLSSQAVADGGAAAMIAFGVVLLMPRLTARFELATAGVSTRADRGLDGVDRGALGGQFAAGALLGAVWSPCVGPTLGGAIALASQGQDMLRAGAIMATFALGISTVIVALGYGARAAIQRRQAVMRRLAVRAKPIAGAVFVAVGAALLLRLHHMAEAWLLQVMPAWLVDLSVSV